MHSATQSKTLSYALVCFKKELFSKFGEIPFYESFRFTVYRLQWYQKQTPDQIPKGLFGKFPGIYLIKCLFIRLQAGKLQHSALGIFKVSENFGDNGCCEFLFREADTNRFSTEQLLQTAFWKTPSKVCKCALKGFQHVYFTRKFPKKFFKTLMEESF